MCPGKEIEKKVVREAFADMLPESVACVRKNNFLMVWVTAGLIR